MVDFVELAVRDVSESGVAIVRECVFRTEIEDLRSALQRETDVDLQTWGANPSYRDHWMVHNLMERDPCFMSALDNDRIHAVLDRVLSPWCILYAYTSSSLPPHGHNYSRRVHVDAQAEVEGYVTNIGVMIALDDFTEENGATRFLRGSHLSLKVPTEAEFLADAAAVYPRAGDAVIFNARTFHLGGINRTDRPRHAVTFNVCRHWMKQRFDFPRMLSDSQLQSASPRLRRFLGFSSRVPVGLGEYYVAPELRLFVGGQY